MNLVPEPDSARQSRLRDVRVVRVAKLHTQAIVPSPLKGQYHLVTSYFQILHTYYRSILISVPIIIAAKCSY